MDIQLQLLDGPDHGTLSNGDRQTFKDSRTILIGRGQECDVTLICRDKTISRHHAKIEREGSQYTIYDTSANGTFINSNSTPIGNEHSHSLINGDHLRIGDYVFQFQSCQPKALSLNKPDINQSIEPDSKQLDNKTITQEETASTKNNLQTTPPQSINFERNIFGKVNESFKPPNSIIPEDWDMPMAKATKKIQAEIPQRLTQPIDLKTKDNELINALFKGMGLNPYQAPSTFTEEQMTTIGRCLRASINGLNKNKEYIDRIKVKLGQKQGDQHLKDDIDIRMIINSILSSNKTKRNEAPLAIIKTQKGIIEEQGAIYKSFNKAIDEFRESLSPYDIEKELIERKKKSKLSNAWPMLHENKWDIYKKIWGEKCMDFKNIIQNQFVKQMNELDKKRQEKAIQNNLPSTKIPENEKI